MDPITAVLSILACLVAVACLAVGFWMQYQAAVKDREVLLRRPPPPEDLSHLVRQQQLAHDQRSLLESMAESSRAAYVGRRWYAPPALCVCGARLMRSRVKPYPGGATKELVRCDVRCGAVWSEVAPHSWAVTLPGDAP